MNSPSNSKRRFLISFGLLGITGILYRPISKYMEARGMAREWAEKWHESPNAQNKNNKTNIPKNTTQVPTLIENDLTLKKADSPWVIDSDVVIQSDVTLTIEAGCEVFIGRKKYMTVNGSILAKGEAENPVHLRAYSNSDNDMWAGIFFLQGSTPSVFQHVEFENCYYGARLVHSTATWISCTFRKVREVCSGYKSKLVFKNCLIDYRNHPQTGNINVLKFHKSSAQVEGCTLYCPDSDYKLDAIDADFLVDGVFRGNRLFGGVCPGADAIDIGHGSRNIVIENNIITDFVDKGISIGEGANAVITNNFIARCAMGVGVKDSAHAKITRTTFHGNDYAIKCYEKTPGEGGGHADIDSCIIASSKRTPFEIDKNSSISFINTLCDQQLLPGKENLQGTPEFEDIEKDRFNCIKITQTNSPTNSCHLLGASIKPFSKSISGKLHA